MIVIHIGTNDVRLRQSEISKNNVKEVCELANTMSDTVICSGPLPAYRLLTPITRSPESHYTHTLQKTLISSSSLPSIV